MPDQLRAALYARVSSTGQRDRHTIESQLRVLPPFCARMGWIVVGTYIDDGKSAAAGKLHLRDDFARLTADAAAGVFDVVAVVDQDRLTRTEDMRERGAILGAFQAAGVKVGIESTGQVLDYRTDEGDLLGSLGAYFAAVENRKRRTRTIAGQTTAAHRGRKPRGRTPFGLAYDPLTGVWSEDPERADVVREIVRRVAAGERVEAIGRALTSRGIERPGGGRWHVSRLREMVAADTYVGRWVVDDRRGLAIAVPQLVDPALVADARAVLAARYRRPPPRTRHHRLLTGIARCGLCGGPVGPVYSGAGTPAQYRCRHRRHPMPGAARCDLPLCDAATLDDRTWAQIVDTMTRSDVVDRALAYVARSDARPTDPGTHRAELERLDRAQSAILAQLARGHVSQEVADAQIDRLGRARRDAQDALHLAQRAAAGMRDVTDRGALEAAISDLARGCELAGPELRARAAKALIGRCVIRPGVLAADLTIDAPTTAPVDGPAWRAVRPVPVRLGTIRVALPPAVYRWAA